MDNTEEVATQHIEYTRTVVPSTMRSPYWKFFGFPSDNANNVLTKQKIVCSLCNAVIAYNKNTSNLRTHIVARHPELLIELYNQKNKKNNETASATLPNRTSPSEPVAKRAKTLYLLSPNGNKGNILSQTSYVSATSESTTGDLKSYNETIIEVNESIEHSDEKDADNSDYEDYPASVTNNTEYEIEEIDDNPIKVTVSLENSINGEEQLLNMLITDLQPPSLVSDLGFQKFATNMGTPLALLQKNQIEQQLNKVFIKNFEKVHQQLTTITNTMPYSLSMECYQNIESKTMMCIYFNHLIPAEARLQFTAYTTIEATSNTDLAAIFSDFNLSNCSAVVIGEENEAFEQFFASHGIPIVPCFETVINNCMINIFAHTAVNNVFKKTLEFFEKHDWPSMLDSIPEVCEENPWSKYNFLQFVQEHVSLADENIESIEMFKQIVGFLNPLKITLETIADEPLPLCSLMKPLSRKLTEEYFSSYFCENEAMTDVKNIVTSELSQRILSNIFFSEASFLDPRFQGVTVENENLQQIKQSIAGRFEHLLAINIVEEKPIKVETKAAQRKSSLKLFFNRGNDQDIKPLQNNTKRSFDYEIMKYTSEAVADLEQCPMKWWEENEFLYRKLRKISEYYMCVPCCMTNLFKYPLNDRITISNRRFMLRKTIANQLWFLHFNRDIIEKFKVDEQSKE